MKQHLMFSGADRVSQALARMVALLIVTRTLGAEGQGVFALFTTITVLASLVSLFGIATSNTYLAKRYQDQNELGILIGNTLAATFVLGLAAAGVVVVVRELAGGVESLAAVAVLPLAVGVLLTTMWTAIAGIVYGLLDFRRQFVSNVMGQGAFIVFIAILAAGGDLSTEGVLWLWNLGLVVNVGYLMLGLIHHVGDGVAVSVPLFKEQLHAGRGAYVYQLSSPLLLRADLLAVALILDPASVGVYSVARSALDFLLFIPAIFNPVILATASAAGAVPTKYFSWLAASLAVATTVSIATAAFAVPLLFGDEFGAAVVPLQILMVGGMPLSMYTVGGHYLMGLGNRRIPAVLATLSAGLALGLSLLLVAGFGLAGGAVGSSIAYVVACGMAFRYIAQSEGLPFWHYFVPSRPARSTL